MKKTLIIVFILLFFSVQGALAIPDPQVAVEKTVNGVLEILQDADMDAPTKKDRISHQMQDFLDIQSMVRRTLGSYWDDANEDQRSRFADLFIKVMEGTYLNKIDDYSVDGTVEYVKTRVKDNKAIVDTIIKAKDLEIPVQYRMLYFNDRWQVFDLVIDGISLIKNYNTSYGEIIRRDGYDGLLTLMEQKVLEMNRS
jgi:phospholipid transport system substrate-binding protein